jgi:hypothetical protein
MKGLVDDAARLCPVHSLWCLVIGQDLSRIRHKSDLENAKALVALGYPAVQPLVRHMLEWIQDGNWPVAHVLEPFLASIGRPILKEIREILTQPEDAEWKWFCIVGVLRRMDRDVVSELRPEIERLAFHPSRVDQNGEVDQVARQLLEAMDKAEKRT